MMKENTNTIIAYNTIILYARLIVISICSLFTTRFALQALGVVDFGLFSVLGSIISFIAIFNTIMISTSNRFIAYALGKGDIEGANEQFNINLIIHLSIAFVTIVAAFPIGDWYIHNYVNFDGEIEDAVKVFRYTIIGSVISFVGVPYNGLLMAKEKFIVFCATDVMAHVLKLIIAYLLIFMFAEKLMVYAISISILTAIPTLIYFLYCKSNYVEITHFRFVRNRSKYREVFSFSSWIGFGAVASVGKNQGAALLVNSFFNTVMNTALGIAHTVGIMVNLVAENINKPIAPQITKSYAAGDYDRSNELLVFSTKFTFLTMFLISSPFFVNCNWVLSLWLGEVPRYAVQFTLLLVIDSLVASFNSSISNIIFASGKIKMYQIIINILRLLSIIVGYVVLSKGYPAFYLLYVYIGFSILGAIMTQWILEKTLHTKRSLMIKGAYLPSLVVVTLFLPATFISAVMPPVIHLLFSFLYLCVIIFYVGLNIKERKYVFEIVKKTVKK